MTDTKAVEHKPGETVLSMLERLRPQLQAALPRSMSADRFSRIVLTEVRKTPRLLECQPNSFLGAVFTAAQIGLEIGSHLGEAFIIPFRNKKKKVTEATLVVGYKGLVKLMWESEQIASLSEVIVRAKDEIEYRQGDGEAILHKPYVPDPDLLSKLAERVTLTPTQREALNAGPPIAYYSIIEMKNGGRRRAFMWLNEVMEHRDRYARNISDDSPWHTSFDAMALKTVIRKVARLAPRSIERPSLQQAIALDELGEAGVSQDLQLPAEVAEEMEGGQKKGLSLDSITEGAVVSDEPKKDLFDKDKK
jgi:recombination protein RecT